ncbi:Adenine nucleotide alpha hydrolases-like superfamily protein [Quillaja saponaria]|uniref:Adenine nucleotide alpha hydrolases-like superfamily protein n=1 Tax=Quillaja saponaria TaxID=32244 RepID=A0AAD7LKU1_QUISA|nr:Adenine nucleotide alpha hydrolases-like superfamily protein [Quillaja saponaria]
MTSSGSFLRQFSEKEAWKSTSNRWIVNHKCSGTSGDQVMEGFNMYGNENGGVTVRKRVMVVVDQTSHSKHALMWALTHVANKGDMLTLLHIVPSHKGSGSSCPTYLVNYLGSLCKDSNPEVEVEALVIQGPKLATVMNQVKKLEVSVLVLGQNKLSSLINCLCVTSSTEEFVEECIDSAECLTIGVRKRSQGNNGYLISTRWQKNFWLLA